MHMGTAFMIEPDDVKARKASSGFFAFFKKYFSFYGRKKRKMPYNCRIDVLK